MPPPVGRTPRHSVLQAPAGNRHRVKEGVQSDSNQILNGECRGERKGGVGSEEGRLDVQTKKREVG